VSNWLRPDAESSPERLFCHVHARAKGNAQLIPGWPYSFVVALEPGRTSWTLPLDAVRLGPEDDATEAAAAQLRDVVARIIAAGRWKPGDPDILIVLDAGYDLTRLAWLLAGLPLEITGRLRSDRVMYFPAPPRAPGANGRSARHGHKLDLSEPQTWPDPAVTTHTDTTRYGAADAMAWARLHQQLARRAAWEHRQGELPIIEGTLIRLSVDHLPGQRGAEPLWRPGSSRRRNTTDLITPSPCCRTGALPLTVPVWRWRFADRWSNGTPVSIAPMPGSPPATCPADSSNTAKQPVDLVASTDRNQRGSDGPVHYGTLRDHG
jgi:DDE superfamily endonuclease